MKFKIEQRIALVFDSTKITKDKFHLSVRRLWWWEWLGKFDNVNAAQEAAVSYEKSQSKLFRKEFEVINGYIRDESLAAHTDLD